VQLARVGDDPRVGREHAAYVGEYLAHVRVERGGQRHGGRVASASSEGRDVELRRHALEARDDRDLPVGERFEHALGAHVDDLGSPVPGVRDDPCLRPRERDRLAPELDDRHRQERHGYPLARGQEHVELARVRSGGDLCG
jgi:hypothetical protein